MINGVSGHDFNIRSTSSLRSSSPASQPTTIDDNDDAALRFLESWSSSTEDSGHLSLDKMLALQGGSQQEAAPSAQQQTKASLSNDDQAAAQIEFLVKSNRQTFQAHGALGSAGIADGWNLAH